MKIFEEVKTEHQLVNIHVTLAGQTREKWVDIHRNSNGELISISIGSKEITAFDMEILDFLRKKGKI